MDRNVCESGRRSSAFSIRFAYIPASGVRRHDGTAAALENCGHQLPHDEDNSFDIEYSPTDEECRRLVAPITEFLGQCTCYQVLGTSTQVALLDVDVPLKVAFIAAQETRLGACVLWDRVAREFCGVLSSTDHIAILLYCNNYPEEAGKVTFYTIREWREKVKDLGGLVEGPNTVTYGQERSEAECAGDENSREASRAFPCTPALVTCSPDTLLIDCLRRIMQRDAKRTIVAVEKAAGDVSLVGVLELQQILAHLGMVFSAESARDVCTECHHSTEGPEFSTTVCDGDLPHHVRNLLPSPTDEERESLLMGLGEQPRVGPYRSILDVPFCLVARLGRNRSTVISVTVDTPLLQALRLLLRHNIDSIAVVSEDQRILDVISRSDTVRIEDQGVYDTNLLVREFINSRVPAKICVFYEKDTLRRIFFHFVQQNVKELFLVDPDTGKLEGQLNISEVVFFLAFAVTAKQTPGNTASGRSGTATYASNPSHVM